MKPFSLLVAIVITTFTAYSQADNRCRVRVLPSVELTDANLTLANLLSPDTCAAVRRAASKMRLGAAPRVGSPRVMEGSQVRALLENMSRKEPIHRDGSGNSSRTPLAAETLIGENSTAETLAEEISIAGVPERVTIRHSVRLASCAEIESRMIPTPNVPVPENGPASVADRKDVFSAAGCGAAQRIPREAPLQLAGRFRDPVLGNWNFVAHCTHPSDCVPFLVQTKSSSLAANEVSGHASPQSVSMALDSKLLLRPGQTATLLWDENGIRLTVPAICLDRGVAGESVRARIPQSGRLVHAIVLSTGELRFQS